MDPQELQQEFLRQLGIAFFEAVLALPERRSKITYADMLDPLGIIRSWYGPTDAVVDPQSRTR